MPVSGVMVDFFSEKNDYWRIHFSFIEAKHYQKMHPEKGFSSFF